MGQDPRVTATSLDSNPLDLGSPASSGGEAEVGNRKGRPITYSNLAVNFVQITLPGPCRKRGGGIGALLGGTEKSKSSLLPKVAAVLQPMCQSVGPWPT